MEEGKCSTERNILQTAQDHLSMLSAMLQENKSFTRCFKLCVKYKSILGKMYLMLESLSVYCKNTKCKM